MAILPWIAGAVTGTAFGFVGANHFSRANEGADLKAAGAARVEMPRSGKTSFCCGGGGGEGPLPGP